MMRDYIDYHYVEPHQLAIHERLLNWANWVRVRRGAYVHPMWRQGRSNSRQWHTPEPRVEVDLIDAQAVEKAVGHLPRGHADSLRWHYVWCTSPAQARRNLGVSNEGLQRLVRDGRQMLINLVGFRQESKKSEHG